MSGLYVASNVSSLVSQNQLRLNMSELSTTLTRLSTGLRINSGKDDPAGLIASELLKSDMTATNKAISNTQRANSVISIADSALGQINSLLNDIKGLVVEAANEGVMSAEQIKANQMQIDASLDAIDRIAKTTNYQGKLLLDGSLGFDTQGVDRDAVVDLGIYQANFGSSDKIDVAIDVLQDADRARLYYDRGGVSADTALEVAGNLGTELIQVRAGASVTEIAQAVNLVSDSTGVRAIVGSEATYGQILLTSAGLDNDINLTALIAGAAGGNYTIKFTAGDSEKTTYTITEPIGDQPGIIEFKLKMQPSTGSSIDAFDESFNGLYSYDITGGDGTAATSINIQSTRGDRIRQVEFVRANATSVPGGVAVTFNTGNGKLQIQYDPDTADAAALKRAIDAVDGLQYISGNLAGSTLAGFVSPTDLRANNALSIETTVAGSQFENTDIVYIRDPSLTEPVALEYQSTAQSAAATLRWGDGTGAADVLMRIVAKLPGTDLNAATVEFEQDDTFAPGDVSVVYDAQRNILHIRGQLDNADASYNTTYAKLKEEIENCSPFRLDVTYALDGGNYPLGTTVRSGLVGGTAPAGSIMPTANTVDSSYIKTGQVDGDVGTDHQALMIRIRDDQVTAADVIAAFNDPANASIAAHFTVTPAIDNDGSGTIFSSLLDTGVDVRVYSGVLTGGSVGYETAVTAAELVELINSDEILNKLFHAAMPSGQAGNGLLTLFDEAAYYGDIWNETALQFLGPAGSPDILFVTDGANQPLGISFESVSGGTQTVAALLAQNADAAFSVTVPGNSALYDNMAIRMIRLDNNYTAADSYAQYVEGPSSAMAYCSIKESGTGTVAEQGKFIVYGVNGGEELNNVSIVAKLDANQDENATAYYDEKTKQLVITVKSTDVTLSDAVTAINNGGLFHAEYDYSFNTESAGNNDTGPALADFSTTFVNGNSVEIGNTGNTGGYNGVLEVYIGGNENEITGQAVVDAINSDPILAGMFAASVLGTGNDAGTGIIDFRADNVRTTTDDRGRTVLDVNMATSVLGDPADHPGYMIVHLATDEYGNSITTARDLVEFMNALTAEQTRGISVSLVRPPGVDNLNRTFVDDGCGNISVVWECDDDYGKGLLQPTYEVDECDVYTYYPIEFFSYGEALVDGFAHGTVVAVGGVDAALEIYARQPGTEYNGVGFRYASAAPGAEPSVEYDAASRLITVFVQAGTTAAQVKALIESSEATKNLFRAELLGDGSGVVTLQDDFTTLRGGRYDAGYRGGARMLGAADEDPHRLVFESIGEGASQWISVTTVKGEFELRNAQGAKATKTFGRDMVATLNGMAMTADGRTVSIESSVLKLDATLGDFVTAGDSVLFSITGGGATFQIGPDVVSNQQIRIGITSVSTVHLGGASGRLYQLRSGNDADLRTNTKLADRIVGEAILAISMLRGRLGAIQRCTLDPNINVLQDSLIALTEAEAQISNADFAEESSKLTRAQILVQAGTKTLMIANQLPQYAASLLG